MDIDGQKLRSLRLDRNWTQQALADATALSLRTIQRMEKHGVASLETVSALCAVLQVPRATLCPVPEPAQVEAARQIAVAPASAGVGFHLRSALIGAACGLLAGGGAALLMLL